MNKNEKQQITLAIELTVLVIAIVIANIYPSLGRFWWIFMLIFGMVFVALDTTK